MRERRIDAKSQGHGGAHGAEGGNADPLRMMVASANRFNQKHSKEVEQFNEATGNECGEGAKANVQQVMAWQRKHGLTPDGKIGQETLNAAQAKVDAAFSEEEAGDIAGGVDSPHASMSADEGGDHSLAGTAVAENATNAPEAPQEEEESDAKMAGKSVGKGIKQAAKGAELVEEMPNGPTGAKVVAGLAMVPYLVELLKEKKYDKVVSTIVGMVGMADRVKILKMALKRAGLMSPVFVQVMEHAVTVGMIADVVLWGWEFVAGSFKALAKAKELGEAHSLLGIYGYAWSQTVIEGRHSNPGAVTASQREAMKNGIADGDATRASQPELAFLLMAEHGDEKNARLALEDALFKREGIEYNTHTSNPE